jgi:two-component system, OmpR family, phosphate regulon sensor histidine kinase PhoR
MKAIDSFVAAPNVGEEGRRFIYTGEIRDTLAGLLGHDLRQFVQIIRGSYDRLRPWLQDSAQLAWLERGECAVVKLAEELESLVATFTVAERVGALELSCVHLGRLFGQLRMEHREIAGQKEITIKVLATDVCVQSNDVVLSCILRNLLTNAVKYSQSGDRVLVGCRRKGQEVRIDVYDSGIGIPEDQLLSIFEPFTRLAPELSDGLGIGLSVVRRALELLGHRVEVRSVSGRGSLFSIYAPASETSERQRLRA